MAPKHDAKFIFTKFINNSGYTSSGWVFIMSFYSPMYGLYGTDGMMHLVCFFSFRPRLWLYVSMFFMG